LALGLTGDARVAVAAATTARQEKSMVSEDELFRCEQMGLYCECSWIKIPIIEAGCDAFIHQFFPFASAPFPRSASSEG
jgi:hypothetical protein